MNDKIEQNLLIYKKYTDLYYYAYHLLEKYPKNERFALTLDIKNSMNSSLKLILYAQKVFEVKDKLKYLNLLDAELMYQRFMIRISYDKKYISQNNYRTWSYKISEIGKMLGGWIKSCQKK